MDEDGAQWLEQAAGVLPSGCVRDALATDLFDGLTVPGQQAGRYLAARYLLMPGLASALDGTIARGEEELRRLGAGPGLVEEVPRLRALQLFTYAARVPPGTVHTRHEFRMAALLARKAGHEQAARNLEHFALVVDNDGEMGYRWEHHFDGDVEPYHRRWSARHHAWAQFAGIDLARLPAGPVREHGRTWHGADGAQYVRASCEGLPGGPVPAVVVRTSAARAEVVAFDSDGAANAWLSARSVLGTGAVPTTADGPACRAVREDEILVRLLRDPANGELRALAGEKTWTSHLRAELFDALRVGRDDAVPDVEAIRRRYQDGLERAPGWALREIGWPHADRAMRYLDRLRATEVTEGQAIAAAQALIPVGPASAFTARKRVVPEMLETRPARVSHELNLVRSVMRAGAPRTALVQPPEPPLAGGPVVRLSRRRNAVVDNPRDCDGEPHRVRTGQRHATPIPRIQARIPNDGGSSSPRHARSSRCQPST